MKTFIKVSFIGSSFLLGVVWWAVVGMVIASLGFHTSNNDYIAFLMGLSGILVYVGITIGVMAALDEKYHFMPSLCSYPSMPPPFPNPSELEK
jgi:predicted tellurium resistance membrane protein TerC